MIETIQKIEDRYVGPVLDTLRSRRWATAIAAGNLAILLSSANYVALEAQQPKPCAERLCDSLPRFRPLGSIIELPAPTAVPKAPSLAAAKPRPEHIPKPTPARPAPPHTKQPIVPKLEAEVRAVTRLPMSAHAMLAPWPASGMLGGRGEWGYDVSHPQCGKPLPGRVGYAIVGLNQGYPNRPNKCLADLLHWAAGATGRDQVPAYINVAAPGPTGKLWPHSTIDPGGAATANPYGACSGNDSLACFWQYGYDTAWRADHEAFQPAARRAGIRPSLAGLYVFSDVEYEGDGAWQGNTPVGRERNQASIAGTMDYLGRIGAHGGIYSYPNAYSSLIGPVAENSPLHGLPLWIATAGGDDEWRQACHTPSWNGGEVLLAQTVKNGLDTDLNCAG